MGILFKYQRLLKSLPNGEAGLYAMQSYFSRRVRTRFLRKVSRCTPSGRRVKALQVEFDNLSGAESEWPSRGTFGVSVLE